MARSKATSRKKSGAAARNDTNALTLLKADHQAVTKLFDEYNKMAEDEGEADDRQTLANQICMELTVHAQIEEEILYPALREAFDDQAMLDEAEVEHASAKALIEQIEEMSPDEELYDAKVKVLGEYIKHHVKEEEGEMFKSAGKCDIDLDALGESLAARRDELREDLGLDASSEEDEEEADDDGDEVEQGNEAEKAPSSRRGR